MNPKGIQLTLVEITDYEELDKLPPGTVIVDASTFFMKRWDGWITFDNPYRYSSMAFALPVHAIKED